METRHDASAEFWSLGRTVAACALLVHWAQAGGEKLEVVTCEHSVMIKENDNCWDIAQAEGMSVDEILKINTGLDCGKLAIGHTICLKRGGDGDDSKEAVE